VSLPSKIDHTEIGRDEEGTAGDGTLRIAVVGRGELVEHVLLRSSEGEATIPDGAEILGVDVATGAVYYAVVRDEYWGNTG
jgi:hypothetical protein